MRSSTGRYYVNSASNQNLSNFFKSPKHPNSLVHECNNTNEKNIALFRYLGYGTIALGINVITVNIVFLPYLFASLDGMEIHVRSNGDIFKAKSNTLWSQMQSLKRNIYRRSIAANSDSLSILELLPKGFIPFPFQKFRLKTFPPSTTPYNFKEMLTKEITKLFEKILNDSNSSSTINTEKKFNDPYSSSSVKEPEGSQIISSDDDEEDAVKNLLNKLKETETTEKMMMEKITELEILESMKNAFKLAEQEERERQGGDETMENLGGYGNGMAENVNNSSNMPKMQTSSSSDENGGYGVDVKEKKVASLITNEPTKPLERSTVASFIKNNLYENSGAEKKAGANSSNITVDQTSQYVSLAENNGSETNQMIESSSFATNELIKEPNKQQLPNQHLPSYQESNAVSNETPSTIPATYNQNTPKASSLSTVKYPIEQSKPVENILDDNNLCEGAIYIETLEDEQKCIGDPGVPGNDGYDGIDGLPGLDGVPGDDGEKAVFGDICNC